MQPDHGKEINMEDCEYCGPDVECDCVGREECPYFQAHAFNSDTVECFECGGDSGEPLE